MVHKDDVENVIKLIYETLLNIKGGETFSYFDWTLICKYALVWSIKQVYVFERKPNLVIEEDIKGRNFT